jgi:hypothetical protein
MIRVHHNAEDVPTLFDATGWLCDENGYLSIESAEGGVALFPPTSWRYVERVASSPETGDQA